MYESLIQELRHGELALSAPMNRRLLMNNAANAIEILSRHDAKVDEIARQACEVRTALGCDTMDDVLALAEEKRLFILPCPIGAPVFVIGRKYRHGRWESWVNPASFRLSDCEKLGKTVFLTEGEARNAIAGIEEVT